MLVVGRLLSQQAELGSKFCVPLLFMHIHPLSDQIDRRGMQIGCFYTRACFICYCLASTLFAVLLSYSLSRIYSIASETSTPPGPSKVILKPRFTHSPRGTVRCCNSSCHHFCAGTALPSQLPLHVTTIRTNFATKQRVKQDTTPQREHTEEGESCFASAIYNAPSSDHAIVLNVVCAPQGCIWGFLSTAPHPHPFSRPWHGNRCCTPPAMTPSGLTNFPLSWI